MSQFRASGIPRRRQVAPATVSSTARRLKDGRFFDPQVVAPGGRYNVYDCQSGHELLSIDIDEGVTPMFMSCPYDGSRAESRFYRVHNPTAFLPVVFVWRLATNGERKKERRNGQDHFASGGLALEVLA